MPTTTVLDVDQMAGVVLVDGVLDGALVAATTLLLRIPERSLKTQIVGGQASGPERLEELPLDTGLVAGTATITTATTIAIVITVALDVEVEDGIGVDQDHHLAPTTPTAMKAPASVQPADARCASYHVAHFVDITAMAQSSIKGISSHNRLFPFILPTRTSPHNHDPSEDCHLTTKYIHASSETPHAAAAK
jgi:hypothetical protein